jgi:ParB-like chromosome segregation protein Spo0J
VPCSIQDVAGQEALEMQLRENVHRADYKPLELATALTGYKEATGLSIRGLADDLGLKHPFVQAYLDLFKYEDDLKNMVAERPDSLRHARHINKVKDGAYRKKLIQETLNGSRETEIEKKVKGHLQQVRAEEPTPARSVKRLSSINLDNAMDATYRNAYSILDELNHKPDIEKTVKAKLRKKAKELREVVDLIETHLGVRSR